MLGFSLRRFWFVSAILSLFLEVCTQAQVSVTTFHNDGARTAQNLSETVLTPGNVNVNTFGKLFSYVLQGRVYAQPLYVPNVAIAGGTHNVLYVATEHDMVYALDADTNTGANAAPLWSRSFTAQDGSVTTVPSTDIGCPDLVPEIGITSTPAIDTTSMTMYVVVRTKENGAYKIRLHALDITTGAERGASPVDLSASVPGTGDGGSVVTLNMLTGNQRSALVLNGGTLYIAFASLCDTSPYHGWLLAYDAKSLNPVAVWNSSPNGYGASIWAGGAAPAVDASGNLFFATGNGPFDVPSGGVDFGDSVLRMPPAPAFGAWQPADYFTPFNQGSLSLHDLDLGAGGVVLLPDQPAGSAHQHLLTVMGKQGTLYLIDRDQLGGYNPVNNSQIVQVLNGATPGLWGIPAWWNNHLYISARNDVVKSFAFDPVAQAFSAAPVSTSSPSYLYVLGSNPSISASGATNGIVWTAESHTAAAIMHAYDATNLSNELFNTTMNSKRDGAGGAVRFMFPTIANGKVYLATNGQLNVYGPLVFAPGKLTFPVQNANTVSGSQTATLTNLLSTPMNIAAISVTGEFGNLSGTCPFAGGTLAPGAQCTVSVAFAPEGGGTLTGAVRVTLKDSPAVFVLALAGTGKSVTAGTGTLNLGTVPVGQTGPVKNLTLTIQGSDVTTFGTASTTNPEFAIVTNTCVGGFTGPAQCVLGLTLTPVGGGTRSGTLNIQSTSLPLAIKLTGTGAALQFSPASLAMGTVSVGSSSAPQSVTVNIAGNQPATFGSVAVAGTNPGDFSIASDTCSGQVVATSCVVSVVFTPTHGGNRYALLQFPNNDGPSPANFSLSGVGRALLTGVTVNPTSATISTGAMQPFSASGGFNDGTVKDITSTAVWRSSNTAVATIGAGGMATGKTTGSSQITATQSGVTGNAVLNVR